MGYSARVGTLAMPGDSVNKHKGRVDMALRGNTGVLADRVGRARLWDWQDAVEHARTHAQIDAVWAEIAGAVDAYYAEMARKSGA